MLAGNFSVWSMVSSLMVRCRATRRLEAQNKYQNKVWKEEEQNPVKKNHNTRASSDWTYVLTPALTSTKTNDFLMRRFYCTLLFTFLLAHDPNLLDRWLVGGGDDAFNTLLDFG